jgi:hypothetical protein
MSSLAQRLAPVLLAVGLACGDSAAGPDPGPGPGPELPRGDVQLLVESYARSGERSFYTMELDGSMVFPFTGIPDDATLVAPSPDGRTIAYLRLTEGDDLHIWLMDRDGGNRRPFLEGTRVVSHIAWSPDGTRLAFQNSTLDDTDDIWVVDADGSDAVNLTPDEGSAVVFDRYPVWSADGNRIAFVSNRTGGMRLWMMDADGTDAVQLVPAGVDATESFPAWSTDGAWIAFLSNSAAGYAIGVVRPNGQDYRTWPVEGSDVGRVAWTPDGRVLYSASVGGDYDVFALDPETGARVDITDHPGHDFRALPLRWVAPSAWLGVSAPTRYATGIADPPAIAAGDVTADGRPDLLLAGPASEQLRVLRGEGNGSFTLIGSLTAPDDQRALAVGDLSRDDRGDVVLLGERALSLWLGGPEAPGVPTTHPFDGDGRGLVVHDFDIDGHADVAAVNEVAGSGFHVLVHGWQPDEERLVAILDYATAFTGAGRACAGDVTGDGAADVVVVTSVAASPLVLIRGHGDISFGDATVAATGILPDASAVPVCADFDGDRRTDLALLQPGRAAGLTIFRSNGTGLVTSGVLGARISAGSAADVDRDGDVDLLLASPDRPAVLFLRNRGDGRFALPAELPMGSVPTRLAIADVDGDLWPDVVAVDAQGSIAVMRNRGR